MKTFNFRVLLTVLICTTAVTGGALVARAQQDGTVSGWSRVWAALQAAPAAATKDGPPVRDGERVLFRFRAPANAARVYLAGSFNAWARNNAGTVTNQRFAMRPVGGGLWYAWVILQPQTYQYKYVVVGKDGKSQWVSDPNVKAVDASGNTVLDVSTLPRQDSASPLPGQKPLRALKPFQPSQGAQTLERPTSRREDSSEGGPGTNTSDALDVRANKVWVRPDQPNSVLVSLGPEASRPGVSLGINVLTPFGERVYKASQKGKPGENRLPIPALSREGGFLAQVILSRTGRTLQQGETVLSVVQNVADDLRYGFYASYGKLSQNYDAKAAMLARFHINAVEFYDYFPAHGYYAPREPQYHFGPFNVAIDARDVQQKIDAGHRRNILSLAYVAAYAASESVYRQHPDPMTDAGGVPKIFNGQIMTETEADRQNKPKWFWLMDVAAGSPWHDYILGEFGRTLDHSPNDLVSFDGFEMDTYGDSAGTKFYAKGGKRSGDLLADVLHDFVGDVQSQTHRIKPQGLVSFNSVNEFGVERMYDVTDFLFLEIWDFYTENLEDLVDICFRNRAPRSQRVILKIYPATMRPGQKSWPADTLRRVLGATMTGAGSLMAVGEPDAQSDKMHALHTLYYPHHQPLSAADEQILRDYYRFDALLYGYTHGKGVVNTDLSNPVAGCLTRTYAVPAKHSLVVQVLNVATEKKWTVDSPAAAPKVHCEVTLELPGGVDPKAVYFASPDKPALQTPVKLDFDAQGGRLRTLLPELRVHGTLVLQY